MGSKWSLVAGTLVVGCSMSGPPPRTQAAVVEARCGDDPGVVDARVVGPQNVDRVEPLYASVNTRPNGMESRLIGAKLHIRMIDGVMPESVGQALVCHQARETLRPSADDACPYAVPGAWVDIQVKPDAMGYEVALRGQDFVEAKQILDRARAFAESSAAQSMR